MTTFVVKVLLRMPYTSQTCDNVHASVQAIHMSKPVMTFVFKVRHNGFGTYSTHVQSCDVTRVLSATKYIASVHTSHMSKAVV